MPCSTEGIAAVLKVWVSHPRLQLEHTTWAGQQEGLLQMPQAIAAGPLLSPPSSPCFPPGDSRKPMQGQGEGSAGSRWMCLHRGKHQDRSGTLVHMLVHMSVFHNHGLEEKSKKPFLKPFVRHHVLYQCDTTSTALSFEVVMTGVL